MKKSGNMTRTEEYFISLLSSHLNDEAPIPSGEIKWGDIFRIAEAQNLTAIIALEIKKLPIDAQPNDKGKSYFKQALGQTIQNTQKKQSAIDNMTKILGDAGIVHTIIKGGMLRQLYPVPEVRTSGDTDVVIDKKDKDAIKNLLITNGFKLDSESVNQLVFHYMEQEFQFKTYFDCLNKADQMHFSLDICEMQQGTTYCLEPTYHLIYVINHLLKHLRGGGVGFRQLMDVDIIIRKQSIDFCKVYDVFHEMNLDKSLLVVLALSKKLFNTPVDIDYQIDDNLFDHITEIMLTGGVFGYGISNTGTVRLANNGSKLKAILSMIFATKEYMYNTYMYANNHHWLLPIAYIHRWFDAIFKRGRANIKNLNSIISNNENATKLAEIKKELEM